MSRASTPTLLSIDRWAKILSLSPVHFSGASGSDVWLDYGACEDVWPQYAWQIDKEITSREEVAMAISNAERDIAQAMGYWPAPTWQADEVHGWPHSTRGAKTIQADWGKIVAPGRRAVTAIETDAAVVYSDPDADGWDELATITVATTVTDKREIKLFTTDMGGLPEWEIRPLRNVVLSGGNAIITIDAWLLIEPELWEVYPSTNGFAPIDIANGDNFVSEVDVYRVYNDITQAGSQFYSSQYRIDYGYWSCPNCNGSGCAVCGVTVQDGCFTVIDSRTSAVRPFPATYADGAWTIAPFSNCVAPAQVALNYYAGDIDQRYRTSQSLDPLSDYLAEAIVWLSVARLPKGICGCGRVAIRVDELQRDMSRFRDTPDSAIYSRFEKMSVFHNSFGTRVGEVKAWERIVNLMGDAIWSASAL